MRRRAIAVLALVLAGAVGVAFAQGWKVIGAALQGYQEVPAVSSTANGQFNAKINRDDTEVTWELSYADLEGSVTQAHIHFGDTHTNGGISVFLCSNLGNGPVGTQSCPMPPATIGGTFTSTDVIGPAGQGIAAGQLAELIAAIRAGKTYANVHSTIWPGGEMRGQLGPGQGQSRGHDH